MDGPSICSSTYATMYSGVDRITTSSARPSGRPIRPVKSRAVNGNSTSANPAEPTSAICETISVVTSPGAICCRIIVHSHVPVATQVADAPRSAPRNGRGTMSWPRNRPSVVQTLSLDTDVVSSHRAATLPISRNGSVDGRTHSRRVAISR